MYLRSDHRERLISLTYKELLEIEKEKKNRLIGKWIKEMNRQLPEKEIQIVLKIRTSFTIRKTK